MCAFNLNHVWRPKINEEMSMAKEHKAEQSEPLPKPKKNQPKKGLNLEWVEVNRKGRKQVGSQATDGQIAGGEDADGSKAILGSDAFDLDTKTVVSQATFEKAHKTGRVTNATGQVIEQPGSVEYVKNAPGISSNTAGISNATNKNANASANSGKNMAILLMHQPRISLTMLIMLTKRQGITLLCQTTRNSALFFLEAFGWISNTGL